MKSRIVMAAIALFCLATLSFGQPAYVTFNYYFCPEEPAMTGNPCWQGTPIADGMGEIRVYEYPGTYLGSIGSFNGDLIGCGPGYFGPEYPITWYPGRQVYAVVEYEGCSYSTISHLYTTVPYDNPIETTQEWWTCSCGNPGCDVKDEQSGLLLGGSKSKEPSGSSGNAP